MQIISVAMFLLGASVAVLALPTQPGAGGCPGGYADGAEVERGRLVYVCQGGNLVPKGCIAEDLSRIAVGANYDNAHYRRACVASGDSLTFDVVGCVQNGQVHAVSETWDDGKNVYTCKQNAAGAEPQLAAENQGCVDSGKRVPKKEKINKDDGVYLCDETPNGGSELVQAGCAKDGKAYNAGDAIEAGKYWFNCTRIGRTKFAIRAAGCINDGKRLNDGDRYNQDGVTYECTIDNDKTDVRAVGCVQNDGGSTIERKLGCTWVQGTAPLQYEVQCVADPATNTAKVVQVRCNYNVGGGVYNIDPGCYRAVDKSAYGCISQGGSLNLQTFESEQAASGAGLHAC